MNTTAYLSMQAAELPQAVHRRLDDLNDEQLLWRPTPRSNHIAFIVWHCLRACDMQLGRARGATPADEVWLTADFAQRTGYDPRGLGTRGLGIGTGYTTAMVDAVPVTKDILISYTQALADAYLAQLRTMEDSDLDTPHEGVPPAAPTRTVDFLSTSLRQFHQHMGECDYLRGLIGIPDPTMPREE